MSRCSDIPAWKSTVKQPAGAGNMMAMSGQEYAPFSSVSVPTELVAAAPLLKVKTNTAGGMPRSVPYFRRGFAQRSPRSLYSPVGAIASARCRREAGSTAQRRSPTDRTRSPELLATAGDRQVFTEKAVTAVIHRRLPEPPPGVLPSLISAAHLAEFACSRRGSPRL